MAQANPFSTSTDPNKPIDPTNPIDSVGGYDATTRTLTPDQTVEGRFTNIMQSGNPLVTQARTRTAGEATGRGLLNSSMAVQAGEQAAMNAALPIAQTDAGFANDVANRNMDATNTASAFGAGAKNTAAGQLIGGQIQTGLQAQQGQIQTGLQAQQGQIQSGLQAQQGQLAQQLQAQKGSIDQQLLTAEGKQKADLLTQQAEIEKQLTALQGEQSRLTQKQQITGELALQDMRNAGVVNATNIEANWRLLQQSNAGLSQFFTQDLNSFLDVWKDPNASQDQKNQAYAVMNQKQQNYLALAGSTANVDLSGQLNFNGGNPTPTNTTNPQPQMVTNQDAAQRLQNGDSYQNIVNDIKAQGGSVADIARVFNTDTFTLRQQADNLGVKL